MMRKGSNGTARAQSTMKTRLRMTILLVGSLLAATAGIAQELKDYKGDPAYHYQGIHNGNKIWTVFFNYGLVGSPDFPSGEWPGGTGDDYVGDVTILVGVEYVHPNGDTIHTVITTLSPRGNEDISPSGVHWGFEPLMGFGAPPVEGSGKPGMVAMSQDESTWPEFWPDRYFNDPRDVLWQRDDLDPGWPGKWNGYFGKDVTNADQESFYEMDDNMDREFRVRPLVDEEGNVIGDTTYYPVAADTSRGGIGIRVGVRGFQWSNFLAEDVFVQHFEITNISDYDYNKVVFGMVVGTLAGGRGDTQDDLAFFDPDNDITYSWDNDNQGMAGWVPVNPERGINVGYIGYAFLESPGNPFDGIDNDGDSPDPSSPVLEAQQLYDWMYYPILNDTTQHGAGVVYNVGDRLVTIDYDTYQRSVVTMPESGVIEFPYQGRTITVEAGKRYWEFDANNFDDNFNGLIDERYGQPVNGKRLDHVGKKYKDYLTGRGVDDPMIDEARDDGIDNDGDWDPQADDVGFDGAAGTGDAGEGDGLPTFGEPNFDKTDIDESDQIGLTAFDYFQFGEFRLKNDADLWGRLRPGNISVVPNQPMDGDFTYGSGYFPLPKGKTQRFSIALFFGEDLQDVLDNKQTVQQIYNSNYNFARPPEKPNVTAVAGDGVVTLYWDDAAERSIDRSMPEGYQEDFEGYKIYRATDPGFLENYVITDGLGRTVFHQPIAVFDKKDGISGFFEVDVNGALFYLGEDTGLQHVWRDTTVENGQTYYYAVTSYDHGLNEVVDGETLFFFPSETSKFVVVDEGGNVTTDVNTVVIVPGVPAAGYTPAVAGSATQIEGRTSSLIYTEVVDPRDVLNGARYRVRFSDADDANIARKFNVYRMQGADDSVTVVQGDTMIAGDERAVLDLYDSYFDSLYGLAPGSFETWRYFESVETPVFDGLRLYLLNPRDPSRYIPQLSGYHTDRAVGADSLLRFTFGQIFKPLYYFFGDTLITDYRIVFTDDVSSRSIDYESYSLPFPPYDHLEYHATDLYFTVEDLRTGESPMLVYGSETNPDGRIHDKTEIMFFYERTLPDGSLDTLKTWSVYFESQEDNGQIYEPQAGDTLILTMYKPFAEGDRYEFTTEAASLNRNKVDLSRIKVYPNPYLGVSTQEPPNPYSSGRGERRINFIHLPDRCTIRIYTVRGELVDTIEHNMSGAVSSSQALFDGTETWDLRSTDGLDVAYGVYIYHVESPYGEHIGKFALIK
ncbi:MAG TPA: hypothetical protein ENI92_00760 [Bacteroidetes bacterium]|nr:hypothetical protein [Bacteroidota bacterium]